MKKNTELIAFITALSLHLIIGGVLLFAADFSLPKEKPKEVVTIIDASLISQEVFDDLEQRKNNKKLAEKRKKENERKKREKALADKKRKETLAKQQKEAEAKAKREKAQREAEAKRAAAEKALAEKNAKIKADKEAKALAKKKESEKLQAQKAAKEKAAKEAKEKAAKEKAAKEAKEKAAKEKAAKEAKEKAAKEAKRKAAAEAERLRQAELDQQMEAEFFDDFSSARSAKQLSEIARYQALIRNKISRNWKVDPSMGGKTCTLAIRLAPDGLVISVNMSRGDRVLCDSARRATLSARTLPIPSDPEISGQFRDFDITLEPEL